MIGTTTTVESQFQVLDPIDSAPPGANLLAYVESGVTQLPTTTNVMNITFTVTKVSAEYLFDELYVKNTTDASPVLFDQPEVTAVSTTGFSILLNGIADTTNYNLIWKVRINT